MPLRSVEAASRDDAIAAAREQFGPAARVVGVRRVRSGGVLGFFATERYVAEVAPDPDGDPAGPVAAPARPAGALTEDPDTGSLAAYGSPLASAAPARARTAPPRNGAAAWAAASARSGAPAPRATPALVGASAGPARRPGAGSSSSGPADDARVDELAGLLGVPAAEPASRTGVAPVSFPRATRGTPRSAVPTEDVAAVPTPAPGAPSPFTAALARMVAGDRDVQHAVRQALETSDAPSYQEEETTVGDHVIAPPAPSVDGWTDLAAWAEEPSSTVGDVPVEEVPVGDVPVGSSREEAIAEVLRAALAEGHSDDALAGILRRAVSGDSPLAVADAAEAGAEVPVVAEHVVEVPVAEEPAAEPLAASQFDLFAPLTQPAAERPAAPAPLSPSPVHLWGEVVAPAPAPRSEIRAPAVDARIWAEPAPADVDVPEPVAAEPVAREPVAAEPVVAGTPREDSASAPDPEAAPVPARTAGDPAPPSRSTGMDATAVLPPLSLLPGSSSRGRGLPPVPPSSARGARPPSGSAPLDPPAVASPGPARVRTAPPSTPADVVARLVDLGVPADVLGPAFVADVESHGTYAALTRALGDRLPQAPELPTGAGDVLVVVGPGVEALRAARSLAVSSRLDPDRVQWATRGDLVGLALETSRMSTVDAALRRSRDAAASGSGTIVAVDVPLRTDADWMTQMLAIWSPVAVWAVVEATRKPEDLEHWLDGLPRVDALVVQDTESSADPAAVLHRPAAPVAVVDGARATPHRWASLLCERLESGPA